MDFSSYFIQVGKHHLLKKDHLYFNMINVAWGCMTEKVSAFDKNNLFDRMQKNHLESKEFLTPLHVKYYDLKKVFRFN